MQFNYSKLAQPNLDIRLVVIEPGSFNDALVGHFISRKLEDRSPAYEALSYVWGAEATPSHFQASSGKQSRYIPITQNLDVALRHLRHRQESRTFWIDALCINQADDEEKGVQVMIMGSIFATAERVISWLGPEENGSGKAIALLQNIAHLFRIDWDAVTIHPHADQSVGWLDSLTKWTYGRRRIRASQLAEPGGRLPWTDKEYQAVYCILTRPYFRRAWILQEIRLARTVLLQCGLVTLNEDDFWKVIHCLSQKSGPRTSTPQYWHRAIRDCLKIAYLRARQETIEMFSLRQYTGRAECRDPRDKIYSTLGIMDELSQKLQIRPDYGRDTKDVYRELSQQICTAWSCLDLFEDCELSTRFLSVPTWAPDWSTPLYCEEYLPLRWSACAWIAGRPTFDETGLCCTVSGVSVAQVTELDSLPREIPTTTGEVFDFIKELKPSRLNPTDRYMTGQSLIEVYCRVLIGDGFRDVNRHGLPDFGVPDFAHSLNLLELAWNEDSDQQACHDAVNGPGGYFHAVHRSTKHRRLFKTARGHIGLAPLETRVGDVLCVIFGCRYPMILRPTAAQTWELVGHCYAHGLMNGETIYRGKHTTKYQFQRTSRIGKLRSRVAFLNPELGILTNDFAALLEEAGIQVESEQDDPPAVFVRPGILEAAGIQVEKFTLI